MQWARGHVLDRLPDQPDGLARLLDPDHGPCLDIAGGEDGHAEGEITVGREGMIAPHVGVDPRSARHVAQHAVVARRAGGEHARPLQTILDQA